MNSDYPITETEFRVWLEARRESVVGKTCIPWSCPVRQCMKELTGEGGDVGTEVTYFGGADRHIERVFNPSWVKQFITKLDNSAQGMALEVTGAEALTFLESSTEVQGESDANGG